MRLFYRKEYLNKRNRCTSAFPLNYNYSTYSDNYVEKMYVSAAITSSTRLAIHIRNAILLLVKDNVYFDR